MIDGAQDGEGLFDIAAVEGAALGQGAPGHWGRRRERGGKRSDQVVGDTGAEGRAPEVGDAEYRLSPCLPTELIRPWIIILNQRRQQLQGDAAREGGVSRGGLTPIQIADPALGAQRVEDRLGPGGANVRNRTRAERDEEIGQGLVGTSVVKYAFHSAIAESAGGDRPTENSHFQPSGAPPRPTLPVGGPRPGRSLTLA